MADFNSFIFIVIMCVLMCQIVDFFVILSVKLRFFVDDGKNMCYYAGNIWVDKSFPESL